MKPYQGRVCRAGGEHTFEQYNAARMGASLAGMFGEFTACSKCGMRPNDMCPKTPAGHGDHNYQDHKLLTEHGIVNSGKCTYCGDVMR